MQLHHVMSIFVSCHVLYSTIIYYPYIHVTCDMWHVTCMWHDLTSDIWHSDIWHLTWHPRISHSFDTDIWYLIFAPGISISISVSVSGIPHTTILHSSLISQAALTEIGVAISVGAAQFAHRESWSGDCHDRRRRRRHCCLPPYIFLHVQFGDIRLLSNWICVLKTQAKMH